MVLGGFGVLLGGFWGVFGGLERVWGAPNFRRITIRLASGGSWGGQKAMKSVN